MKKALIIIVVLIVLAVAGFYALNGYIYNEKQGDPQENIEARESYTNIPYMLEGQMSMPTYFGNEAYGDINADGREDIAFIVTQNLGGTGTFYYIVVALKTDMGYVGTNGVLLGDRIAPQSTRIEGPEVVVNYADRKPDEPMVATPSVGVTKYFIFEEGQLHPLVVLQ